MIQLRTEGGITNQAKIYLMDHESILALSVGVIPAIDVPNTVNGDGENHADPKLARFLLTNFASISEPGNEVLPLKVNRRRGRHTIETPILKALHSGTQSGASEWSISSVCGTDRVQREQEQ